MTENEYRKEAEKIRPRLVNLARRYMGNSSEADDMVQDAMLKLWAMHGELHSPMEKLACVMVRNQYISSLRRNKPEYSALQLADTTIATDSEERGKKKTDRTTHECNGTSARQTTNGFAVTPHGRYGDGRYCRTDR